MSAVPRKQRVRSRFEPRRTTATTAGQLRDVVAAPAISRRRPPARRRPRAVVSYVAPQPGSRLPASRFQLQAPLRPIQVSLTFLCCVPETADGLQTLRMRLPHLLSTLDYEDFPGRIFVVDDASTDSEHLRYLDSLPEKFEVVRRAERGGSACGKNTCLRLISDSFADFGFVVEDDVVFHCRNWHDAYVEAHQMTGIQHFSWRKHLDKNRVVLRNGYAVTATHGTNGLLTTVTPELLKVVGGLRVLPRLWGHAHGDHTRRCIRRGFAPFYVDVADSRRFVQMGKFHQSSSISARHRTLARQDNPAVLKLLQAGGDYAPLQEDWHEAQAMIAEMHKQLSVVSSDSLI